MKIGIIGAGFTGLSAAYSLIKQGHSVVIFEKDTRPGGLAIGHQEVGWEWTLEYHYHHWFTNDNHILRLAKEINHRVLTKTPETNWYVNGKIYQFVSLKAALTFPLLTPLERFRHLAALGLIRFNPIWKPLEKINATTFLPKYLGKKAYSMLWEPLLHNKFGNYAGDISLAWFWARIVKRTQALVYPEGGFLSFAEHLVENLRKKGADVIFDNETIRIEEKKTKIHVSVKHDNTITVHRFDKVIVTVPSFLFLKLTPQLPDSYKNSLHKLKGIGATNLILRLKKPFFTNNTYWLSIADKTSPVMAIVEHTNFMDKKHYNNEHLVYVGNYLSPDDPNFKKGKEELLKYYDPFLKRINKDYKSSIIDYNVFKAPFAQPIIPTNYSKLIPPFATPLENVFLANMEQVYPWDRGTNYAVELGEKIASFISK